MILLDSDVLIDLFRKYPPALRWFDSLPEDEQLMVPGFVVMELIQGCRNKTEQEKVMRDLATCGVAWLSPHDCDLALKVFAAFRLSHNAGLLDALIGQTAVALGSPLHTFNQKHYGFMPALQTVQPYVKTA